MLIQRSAEVVEQEAYGTALEKQGKNVAEFGLATCVGDMKDGHVFNCPETCMDFFPLLGDGHTLDELFQSAILWQAFPHFFWLLFDMMK